MKYFRKIYLFVFTLLSFITVFLEVNAAVSECTSKEKICSWLDQVVGIKTPMMIASGTIYLQDYIITNRHVVEDHEYVIVKFSNGKIKRAFPLYHNVPSDLVLLTFDNKNDSYKNTEINVVNPSGNLRVIGYDQGRKKARIYKSGEIIAKSSEEFVQARIHTNAKSLPGNSGGAVVDDNGELIGILASGSGTINEIIPIFVLNKIIKNISDKHKKSFNQTGFSIRMCADNLHLAHNIKNSPDKKLLNDLVKFCKISSNKQLLDNAGTTLGRWGYYEESSDFLNSSMLLDPNSPNTLLSLAIAYHLDRKIKKEKPIIEKLLKLTPTNPQVLRLGVQVAGILKDKTLAEKVINLMKLHNPNALDLANEFLENAFSK